jgi:endonuclease/exonuclease/phosphatase family metal-dependent hydrolase|tara:strand:+ start:420 stop:1259 length:840 start_codon:yes stop_codon:yes gene_type:complete
MQNRRHVLGREAGSTDDHVTDPPGENRGDRLRLLSFNIQVGIQTESFHHYFTRGWQHLLPTPQRIPQLDRIARLLTDYDVVALQETDGGSLRSGFVNQVEYLADVAGFPYWYLQRNRDLGMLAQNGNGLLSRAVPQYIEDHKLPGKIPGRGAILCCLRSGEESLALVIVHLSLGPKDRARQLAYLREMIADYRHVVLMGDMNTQLHPLLQQSPLKYADLHSPVAGVKTYPSWRPKLCLDHILLSSELSVNYAQTADCNRSDHLPIAVEISLPYRSSGRH